jgi:hypothetical protein
MRSASAGGRAVTPAIGGRRLSGAYIGGLSGLRGLAVRVAGEDQRERAKRESGEPLLGDWSGWSGWPGWLGHCGDWLIRRISLS